MPQLEQRPLFFGHEMPREACKGPGLALFTLCTHARAPLFVSPDVVLPALDQLIRALHDNVAWTPVYCFMPDHLHVLAQGLHEASDVWLAIVQFKRTTGAGLPGMLPVAWQRGFDTRFLQPGVSVEAAASYVRNNPVRAGLAAAWQDYPFTGTIEINRWGAVGPRRSRRGTPRL